MARSGIVWPKMAKEDSARVFRSIFDQKLAFLGRRLGKNCRESSRPTLDLQKGSKTCRPRD